ncbi:CLN3 protein [Helicosporidium sp. ATCC 50920]|nr:CLN3 protein [Helicosporidium sp. ATCC 50920]|eukprot:KDD73692.1 CLN3 protein [Helicosporidium sp. ATCC 50920]
MAVPLAAQTRPSLRVLGSFFLLGMLNNMGYVIMLAGATTISASGVGLVYLCAIVPSLSVKASAPHWFHRVRYGPRMATCAALMSASFCAVALSRTRSAALLGVALGALQGGLGEASMLALSARYGGPAPLTAWASGTGLAGLGGYAWVGLLHDLCGLSFPATLLLANALAAAYAAAYFRGLGDPGKGATESPSPRDARRRFLPEPKESTPRAEDAAGPSSAPDERATEQRPLLALETASEGSIRGEAIVSSVRSMTARERLGASLALWPCAAPLFLVFFSEYALQAGTWSAVGFPVSDAEARRRFYVVANALYQAGVFVSRSSGTLWEASLAALWAMPLLQAALLVGLTANAAALWWNDWSLAAPCFLVGLLGGAVYVQAFARIAREAEPHLREFSLAAASLADALGIALADAVAVLIQGCLFRVHGIRGADFGCGWEG